MNNRQICVAVYMTHPQADEAFSRLQVAGFALSSLSIIGRDYWTKMVGSRNTGIKFKYLGDNGAFWERLWANLTGWGVFWFFADGPVMVAGPLVGTIIASQEQEQPGASMSSFEAGLTGIGIPRESLAQYEASLMKNHILLFVFGNTSDIERAQAVLNETKAVNHTVHHGVGELSNTPNPKVEPPDAKAASANGGSK